MGLAERLRHIKHDHRMDKNLLKGILGDHINAILVGTVFNFRKLIRFLIDFFVRFPNVILRIRIVEIRLLSA